MKLFDGTGFLLQKTGAGVITAYIRGAERLPLSPNVERKRFFPRISVHFSAPAKPPRPGHKSASEARTKLTEWLRREMARQRFEVEMKMGETSVAAAIAKAARADPSKWIMEDASGQKLSYRRLEVGGGLLAGEWTRLLVSEHPRVGVLLPNVIALPVVLQSLWKARRVPAILNYSAGAATMLNCARLAGLREIITSRRFIEHLKLDPAPFAAAGIRFIHLEDTRAKISAARRVWALLAQTFFPRVAVGGPGALDTPAVVLFTSGSEGEPKGVELSHRNILSNIQQVLALVDIVGSDRFFNAMPLFHCFGLTFGALLPLVRGVGVYLYPSPLHYRVVPSALYNQDCTIFFGTNTFLAGYARKANPYDFRSVRYVFAGAEKLQESTSRIWMQRFGVRILEGYGATECSPCISINSPLQPGAGTAGEFVPGMEFRLEAVEGIRENDGSENQNARRAGRLHVRGPNVMRGYLNEEANAEFQALGGWYDTGDIVEISAGGFIRVLGWLKRFAKISGEMVSLTAVEDALAGAFPEVRPEICRRRHGHA